jgi:5-methylcytosine-specific restriction endonuclease McrA
MKIIDYINSKRTDNQSIRSLSELSDQEYEHYYKMRIAEMHPYKAKPKKVKEVKDEAKTRKKYDTNLSAKHKRYLGRANAKKLPFHLTPEDFEKMCKGTCVYCGQPATGIDRRDNKKGYTYNNSQPCCYTCNHMKWGMTEYNFLEHIKIILRNFYKE